MRYVKVFVRYKLLLLLYTVSHCYQSGIGKVGSKFLPDGFPRLIYGARRKALATIDLGVSYPFGRARNSFVGLGSPPPFPPTQPWSFVVPKCPSSLEYYNNSQKAFVTKHFLPRNLALITSDISPPHNPLNPPPPYYPTKPKPRAVFICISDYAQLHEKHKPAN